MKKGAALPTAIALCSFLLIVTTVVTMFLMSLAMNNKYNRIIEDQETMFARYHNEFMNNGGANISFITDETFVWQKYDGENDQKALVARFKSSNDIKFYTICDFHDLDNIKTLAYQIDVIYAPYIDGVQYLGGIFPIGGNA